MYYLEIDVSKKSFTVSILDKEGEAIAKFLTFPCTRKGAEELVDKISSLKLKKSAFGVSLIRPPTGSMLVKLRDAAANTIPTLLGYPSRIFTFILWLKDFERF